MNTKTIRPLRDNILVRRKDPEKVTSGGLHIPDSKQLKSRVGEVLAVGPGKYLKDSASDRIPMQVEVGQDVYFRGTSGEEVDDMGQLVMLRSDEVEGIVT